jgi:hypothetical protein
VVFQRRFRNKVGDLRRSNIESWGRLFLSLSWDFNLEVKHQLRSRLSNISESLTGVERSALETESEVWRLNLKVSLQPSLDFSG